MVVLLPFNMCTFLLRAVYVIGLYCCTVNFKVLPFSNLFVNSKEVEPHLPNKNYRWRGLYYGILPPVQLTKSILWPYSWFNQTTSYCTRVEEQSSNRKKAYLFSVSNNSDLYFFALINCLSIWGCSVTMETKHQPDLKWLISDQQDNEWNMHVHRGSPLAVCMTDDHPLTTDLPVSGLFKERKLIWNPSLTSPNLMNHWKSIPFKTFTNI